MVGQAHSATARAVAEERGPKRKKAAYMAVREDVTWVSAPSSVGRSSRPLVEKRKKRPHMDEQGGLLVVTKVQARLPCQPVGELAILTGLFEQSVGIKLGLLHAVPITHRVLSP